MLAAVVIEWDAESPPNFIPPPPVYPPPDMITSPEFCAACGKSVRCRKSVASMRQRQNAQEDEQEPQSFCAPACIPPEELPRCVDKLLGLLKGSQARVAQAEKQITMLVVQQRRLKRNYDDDTEQSNKIHQVCMKNSGSCYTCVQELKSDAQCHPISISKEGFEFCMTCRGLESEDMHVHSPTLRFVRYAKQDPLQELSVQNNDQLLIRRTMNCSLHEHLHLIIIIKKNTNVIFVSLLALSTSEAYYKTVVLYAKIAEPVLCVRTTSTTGRTT